MDYRGTTAPVLVQTYVNVDGDTVTKWYCPDSTHSDYQYRINSRIIVSPIDTAMLYRIVPERTEHGAVVEHAKYVHTLTGEVWNFESDRRAIRAGTGS